MIKAKLTILGIISLGLAGYNCQSLPAIAGGGFRVDQAGWFVDIPNKAANISLKIYGLRLKLEVTAEDSWRSWLPFVETKNDVKEDISNNQNYLKTYLASTPRTLKKKDFNVVDTNRSNKEIHEVSYAIVNMNELIKKYRNELKNDKANIESAQNYYTVQYECFVALYEMNDEFITNIKEKYKPTISEIITALTKLNKESQEELSKLIRENDINFLKKTMSQQEIAIKEAQDALTTLEDQRVWATQRLDIFEDKVIVTDIAKRTAIKINMILKTIEEINNVLTELEAEPLPLLAFETDISKLQILSTKK